MKKIDTTLRLPREALVRIICLYQRLLSPDHSWLKKRFPFGYCRFYPTCSEYSKQAIKKYGIIIGVPKSLWRVARCNPWSKGGEDLLK